MIVSHKHRFIFLKTMKAGGTSIELALRSLCGDDDIITPLLEDGMNRRRRRPQNFLFPMHEWPAADCANWQRGRRPDLSAPHRLGFYNHFKAAAARARLGDQVWSSYFKFSVERNPWDRQVSFYHFSLKHFPERAQLPFPDFVGSTEPLDNWSTYAINDEVVVDHIIRYNRDLLPGLNAALRHVALSVPRLPNAKSSNRPGVPGDYRRYYDDATRRIVEDRHHREIAYFGWTF